MVPPCSDRISRVPPYSSIFKLFTHTGLSPTMACFSKQFWFLLKNDWPSPRSLATTNGVSFDFLSSGYLDVSVPQVCFAFLCIQNAIPHCGGFPHSDIHGSKLVDSSPWLFAACHVLHRLSMPRHPPNALMRLIPILSYTEINLYMFLLPTWNTLTLIHAGGISRILFI